MAKPYNVTLDPIARTVTIVGVPVIETLTDITLRSLTRRDRSALAAMENSDDYDERLLELLCIKFGKEPGINAMQLADEKYDEVMAVFAEVVIAPEVRSIIFRKPAISISG